MTNLKEAILFLFLALLMGNIGAVLNWLFLIAPKPIAIACIITAGVFYTLALALLVCTVIAIFYTVRDMRASDAA